MANSRKLKSEYYIFLYTHLKPSSKFFLGLEFIFKKLICNIFGYNIFHMEEFFVDINFLHFVKISFYFNIIGQTQLYILS